MMDILKLIFNFIKKLKIFVVYIIDVHKLILNLKKNNIKYILCMNDECL